MRNLLSAVALATALISTAAGAREAFSGPFVGVQAGLGRREIDSFGIDQHRDGLDYGAFAGLDLRLDGGPLVVGAQADIGDGGRSLSRNFPGVGPTRADPGRNWSASGRIGLLASPDILLYARLGYAQERLRTTFSNSTPALLKQTRDGTLFGAGLEYAVRPNASLRVEYRYSDFGGGYNPQQALLGIAFRF